MSNCKENVKFIVQRLLEEIEKEIIEAELAKEGKGYYRFFDNVQTLRRVKYLIEEAFADVLKED